MWLHSVENRQNLAYYGCTVVAYNCIMVAWHLLQSYDVRWQLNRCVRENMDIKEFVQRVQPRKKRSRLIPFADQIRELKTQGYTDLQIRDWLAENSLEVSRETVRKFVKNGVETATNQASDITTGTHDAHKEDISRNTSTAVERDGLSQADKIRKKLEDQKRDADSTRFKHDRTGNI